MRESKREAYGPEPGELIAGRFRLTQRLSWERGTGLYRAYQEDRGRFVALRIWRLERPDEERVARFRQLALRLSQRTSPNTIQLLDYGYTPNGHIYLAMEHLEGQTLAERLAATGPLTPSEATLLLSQIARSLEELHANDQPHGALLPSAIFLCAPGTTADTARVKVLDFGLDRLLRPQDDLHPEAPSYRAPEQLLGEEETPATDLYALGQLLRTALTGDPQAHLPQALEQHPLAVVLRRTCAPRPIDRIPHASALLDFLQHLPREHSSGSWALEELAAETAAFGLTEPHLLNLAELQAMRPERAEELAWLGAHLNAVANGAGARLLLLTGGTGWGKSTLLRTLHTALQPLTQKGEDLVFLLNRATAANPEHREGGLWADLELLLGLNRSDGEALSQHVREALVDVSSIRESHIQAIVKLLRHDPELRSALHELRGRREELFQALRKPFLSIARRRTLVWFIEDLHRADPILLRFVLDLLDHLTPDIKLLLIGTLEPGVAPPGSVSAQALATLLRGAPPRVFKRRIQGLSLSGATYVLQRRLGAPVTQPSVERLRHHTSGQPRFLLEAAAELQRRRDLLPTPHGAWSLAFSDAIDLPPSLETLLLQRLQDEDGPDAHLLPTLELVALLGPGAPRAWVEQLHRNLQPHSNGLHTLLLRALERDHLREHHDTLRFTVPTLQRELLREHLRRARLPGPPGEEPRRRLRAAAELLLQLTLDPSSAQLHDIAERFVAAGDPQQALQTLLRAADHAYRTFHLEAALEHYLEAWRIAQETPGGPPTTPAMVRIPLHLGELYGALGEPAVAEDLLAQARALAERCPDDDAAAHHARAFQLEGELALQRGQLHRAAELLRQARDLYDRAGDEPGLARVTIDRAWLDALDGRILQAQERLLEALVLAELLNAPHLQAHANLTLARTHLRLGNLQHALRDANLALHLYEQSQNLNGLAATSTTLGKLLLLTGAHDEARTTLLSALDARLRLGDRPGVRHARLLLAGACAVLGDLRAAAAELERHPEDPELRLAWIDLLALRALNKRRRGERRAADALLDDALQHYAALGLRADPEDTLYSVTHARRAVLLTLIDEHAEARNLLTNLEHHPWSAPLLAWLAIPPHDGDDALQLLQPLLPTQDDNPRAELLRIALAVHSAAPDHRAHLLRCGFERALATGLTLRAIPFQLALDADRDRCDAFLPVVTLIGW